MFFDTGFLRNDEIQLVLEQTTEGNDEKGWVPAYYFAICDLDGNKMGTCVLRVGYNERVYYGGNIGYHVFEEFRGRHYAGKACNLLFELARKHEMNYLIITCSPDNIASRKTCEYVGGELLEVAELPDWFDRKPGQDIKCIFRYELGAKR